MQSRVNRRDEPPKRGGIKRRASAKVNATARDIRPRCGGGLVSPKKRRTLAAGPPFRFLERQTTIMARLWATTGDAAARLDEDGDGRRVDLFLQGTKAQCLAADPRDPDTVYVGLRESGIRKTTDGGATWHERELPEPAVFSLAVGPVDGAVYAGTEPSRLFRSDDGGGTWRELTALLELPSRPTWSFPPRPWTSHVRWIAPSPHDADLRK